MHINSTDLKQTTKRLCPPFCLCICIKYALGTMALVPILGQIDIHSLQSFFIPGHKPYCASTRTFCMHGSLGQRSQHCQMALVLCMCPNFGTVESRYVSRWAFMDPKFHALLVKLATANFYARLSRDSNFLQEVKAVFRCMGSQPSFKAATTLRTLSNLVNLEHFCKHP